MSVEGILPCAISRDSDDPSRPITTSPHSPTQDPNIPHSDLAPGQPPDIETDDDQHSIQLLRQLIASCYEWYDPSPTHLTYNAAQSRDAQLLLQELQNLGRAPSIAYRFCKALTDETRGRLSDSFDLVVFAERIGLLPIERLVLAAPMVSSEVEQLLANRAMILLHSNWADGIRGLSNLESDRLSREDFAALLSYLLVEIREEHTLEDAQRLELLSAVHSRLRPDSWGVVTRHILPSMKLPPNATFIQALNQLGPEITSDLSTVRIMLNRFGFSAATPPKTPSAKEIIGELVCYAPRSKFLCDINALIMALADFPDIDWSDIILCFDLPKPSFVDRTTLAMLIAIVLRSPKNDYPSAISGFWLNWTNSRRQLQLLDSLLSLPSDTFNLSQLPGRRIISSEEIATFLEIPRPALTTLPHDPWNSLDLMELLIFTIETGPHEDAAVFAKKILDRMHSKRPELVLLGLMQIDRAPGTFRQELCDSLVRYFLAGHSRDDLALKGVYQYQPDYLVHSFFAFYQEDNQNVQRILDIAHYIGILQWLLNLPNLDNLILKLAVQASGYELIALEDWLRNRFIEPKAPTPHSVLAFMSNSLEDASLCGTEMAIFLRVLDSHAELLNEAGRAQYHQLVIQSCLVYPGLMRFDDSSNHWEIQELSPEVEARVKGTYEQLSKHNLSVQQVMSMLRIQKNSSLQWDQQLLVGFLRLLFIEASSYASTHSSEEGLQVATLLGSILAEGLVGHLAVEVAKQLIVNALTGPSSRRTVWFGIAAASCFMDKLPLWPEICAAILEGCRENVIPGRLYDIARAVVPRTDTPRLLQASVTEGNLSNDARHPASEIDIPSDDPEAGSQSSRIIDLRTSSPELLAESRTVDSAGSSTSNSVLSASSRSDLSYSFSSMGLASSSSSSSSFSSSFASDVSTRISLIHNDPIGGGGFCDLFLGEDRAYGKVALKRPRFTYSDSAIVRRFRREADLWHRVKHPNILPFIGTCQIGRNVYMVSPFVDNGNLLQHIRQHPGLDRFLVLKQIADAVAYLHDIDIVHGDLKGLNVLVGDDGSALLCDFGLSKALDSMETSTEAKGRGSTRWMAPELFTGGNKTKESDVYAYGMTIAEVLTGEAPFSHLRHNQAVMFEVVINNVRPPRQPEVAPDGSSYDILWDIAELCWDASPQGRPSMNGVLVALTGPA